jgi:hypothetical protein
MKYIKNPNTKCTCSNPRHHATWVLNEKGILNSIRKVLATGDSDKLTKDAYDFLYLTSGFIAHYNVNGFKHYYRDTELLRNDLKRSSDLQDYDRYVRDGYFSKGEQSAYYAQKANIYKELKSLLARPDYGALTVKALKRAKLD